MLKDDFPKIWVPSWENRDVRQLLWHRHRMVQTHTRIMNQLQAAALNEGLRYKKKLWREAGRQQLESLPLAHWASRRRRDLLEVLDRINPTIAELTRAIEQQAEKCPEAQRLMTHPGVGALTTIAFVVIIGKADRFSCGPQRSKIVLTEKIPVFAVRRAGPPDRLKLFDCGLVCILLRFGQEQVVLGVDQLHPTCGLAGPNVRGEDIGTLLHHPVATSEPHAWPITMIFFLPSSRQRYSASSMPSLEIRSTLTSGVFIPYRPNVWPAPRWSHCTTMKAFSHGL